TESIISTAAAHHRLVWIHPFMDRNGRIARLMSHAMMLDMLDTGAVWSVARGLARSVQEYKRLLSNCDAPRRNDLDGRGALSEEALAEFTHFFLSWRVWCSPIACVLAFCCGRRRKSGSASCPPGRAAFSKPCFTGENCHAAMPTPWWAPANGRHAASSRHSSKSKCWYP